jgi:hypothetical protein
MTSARWLFAATFLLLLGGGAGMLLQMRAAGDTAGAEEWSPLDQEGRIRVEVLNGGGRRGMARLATQQLRDAGIDVVYMGNADSFGHDSSVVLDRIGRPEDAARVAAALGLEDVRSEPDSALLLDVTVLLGFDWGELDAAEGLARPAETGEVPWWDLRRLWR